MSDPATDFINKLKGIKFVTYAVVIVLIIMGIANFTDSLRKIYSFTNDLFSHYQGKVLTDAKLKTQALETARNIMTMVSERQASEPPIDFKNWEASTQAMIRHSQETQNIYYKEYAAKVAHFREEFLKRELRDKELDMFYAHPTNYIGLRILATKLGLLANKI